MFDWETSRHLGARDPGGSIEIIWNAGDAAEVAMDEPAQLLFIPIAGRRQLNDMPDDLRVATEVESHWDAVRRVLVAL